MTFSERAGPSADVSHGRTGAARRPLGSRPIGVSAGIVLAFALSFVGCSSGDGNVNATNGGPPGATAASTGPGPTCVRTTMIPGAPGGEDLNCSPGTTSTVPVQPTRGTIDCTSVPTTGTVPGMPADADGGISCPTLPGVDSHEHGVIEGRVVTGPQCPVVRQDQPCPDRLSPATITATGERGTYTITTQTGRFVVDLPIGDWTFRAVSPAAMSCPPVVASVRDGITKNLTITCDSGIR